MQFTEVLDIIIYGTVILGYFTIVNDRYHIAKGIEEILIMGNDNKSSLVAFEGLDQGVNGIVVQMICWLIEEENLWCFVGNQSEGYARFLSS